MSKNYKVYENRVDNKKLSSAEPTSTLERTFTVDSNYIIK